MEDDSPSIRRRTCLVRPLRQRMERGVYAASVLRFLFAVALNARVPKRQQIADRDAA